MEVIRYTSPNEIEIGHDLENLFYRVGSFSLADKCSIKLGYADNNRRDLDEFSFQRVQERSCFELVKSESSGKVIELRPPPLVGPNESESGNTIPLLYLQSVIFNRTPTEPQPVSVHVDRVLVQQESYP